MAIKVQKVKESEVERKTELAVVHSTRDYDFSKDPAFVEKGNRAKRLFEGDRLQQLQDLIKNSLKR